MGRFGYYCEMPANEQKEAIPINYKNDNFQKETKTTPNPQSTIYPVLHPFLDLSCAHWSWDHLTVSSSKMTLSVQPNTGAKDL